MISPNDWKVFEFHPGICYTEPGDSMYNQEIKERFLASGLGSERHSALVFAKGEQTESKLAKDVAEMDKEETLSLMNACGFEGYFIVDSVLSALRRYVEYCEENKVFETIPRGVFDIHASDIDVFASIQTTLFCNDLDFLTTLQSVREFNEGYPEPPVLCLAWLGLKAKEITTLADSDVDMERRKITIGRQTVVTEFSDAIAEVLQQYIDCKTAERDHRTGWRQVIKDYSTGYFLKRMLPRGSKDFGKPYGVSQISTAISKLNNKLVDDGKPGRLKFDNVWNSGRYYKLWKTEQSGIDVTKPANRPIVEEILRSSKSYYNAIRMYKAYKKAFDLENKIPAQK